MLPWKYLLLGLLGVAIALSAGAIVAWRTSANLDLATTTPPSAESSTAPDSTATDPATDLANQEPVPNEDLLGHLPYDEAPESSLRPVTPNGSILLRAAAAERFEEMVEAAESEGIFLVPVSGFRTIDLQEELFFEVKAERGQVASQRAEVSAPPGYSEHHTGYAIDVVDGTRPDIGLIEEFETTPAFQWLEENAAFYSFEMSFPRDNAQGISYEPWHWRFVGDRHSLETFYRASRLTEEAEEIEEDIETDPSTNTTIAPEQP